MNRRQFLQNTALATVGAVLAPKKLLENILPDKTLPTTSTSAVRLYRFSNSDITLHHTGFSAQQLSPPNPSPKYAYWDTRLTDEECHLLSKGSHPTEIQGEYLVMHEVYE
jgi:hypothetical protein